jgi:UDP-N-acetylmuramyl pentapeptide phosphotransferase/UDP-N-acetylglucosamine-1-phosphate transferase
MNVLRDLLVQDMARALLLAAAAFGLTLAVGAWWVRFAWDHELGKRIRREMDEGHQVKAGTPTMGGVMIVSTVLLLTLVFNVVDRWSMLLPLAVMVSFGILGAIDDWLTIQSTRSKQTDQRVNEAESSLRLAAQLGSQAASAAQRAAQRLQLSPIGRQRADLARKQESVAAQQASIAGRQSELSEEVGPLLAAAAPPQAATADHGLSELTKGLLMAVIALIASLALYLPQPYGLAHEGLVQIPFFGEVNIGLWFIPIAVLIILATAHSVNFTDGQDSLAGWTLTIAFASYGILTFLAEPRLTNLMAFSFTVVGACAAFLWYNAHPAQVFMGDLGSLALGATLAVVALQSQQWLLLPVIGFVFVVEGASVALQKLWFQFLLRTRGRDYAEANRLFRRAPLHHHFERPSRPLMRKWEAGGRRGPAPSGLAQTTITQRFVLVSAVAAMIGISLALLFGPPSAGVVHRETAPIAGDVRQP